MTYAIHIVVQGGQAQVSSQTEGPGAPPDGVYTINGSVGGGITSGETAESIGISRNELPPSGSLTGIGGLRASANAYVVKTP